MITLWSSYKIIIYPCPHYKVRGRILELHTHMHAHAHIHTAWLTLQLCKCSMIVSEEKKTTVKTYKSEPFLHGRWCVVVAGWPTMMSSTTTSPNCTTWRIPLWRLKSLPQLPWAFSKRTLKCRRLTCMSVWPSPSLTRWKRLWSGMTLKRWAACSFGWGYFGGGGAVQSGEHDQGLESLWKNKMNHFSEVMESVNFDFWHASDFLTYFENN